MKNYIMLIRESRYYVNIEPPKNMYEMIGNEEKVLKNE